LPNADEQFLAKQLRYELRPDGREQRDGSFGKMPGEVAGEMSDGQLAVGQVAVGGVTVRIGEWVWVRLETNAGLTMTEPALLLGARQLCDSLQLTLRGLDRLTFTCITQGPGWTRRIVPMDEADIWRNLTRQERLLTTKNNPAFRRKEERRA
jgi:hypothetical protein